MGLLSLGEEVKGVLFMRNLPSLLRPPYIFLVLGVIFLFVGVVSTCTGVSWARFGRVIYRDKEPNEFWWDVGVSYLGGVFFIGVFIYRLYGL